MPTAAACMPYFCGHRSPLKACLLSLQLPVRWHTSRPRTQQQRQPLWQAFGNVLALLDQPAMLHFFTAVCTGFLEVVLTSIQQDGASSWAAIQCLKTAFLTAKTQVQTQTRHAAYKVQC